MSSTEQKQRLAALRVQLKKLGVAGVFVPRNDEFQGEYVPDCAERLRWITGFTGSWGTALIGQKSAALVVDGRYTIQASRETHGLGLTLLSPEAKSLEHELSSNFKPNAAIGFDPWLTSIHEARRLVKITATAGMRLVALKKNPIDLIWHDRPPHPAKPVIAHPLKFAGETVAAKLKTIASALHEASADVAILADPLAVAWSFNVRGSDIPHTPAALLRAIVLRNGRAMIFVDPARLKQDVVKSLGKAVTLHAPSTLQAALKNLGQNKQRIMLDPSFCPEAIRLLLQKSKAEIVEAADPCSLPRARKNLTEQRGSRMAHVRDGAALCNFLHWLQNQKPDGVLTEQTAQDQLAVFRHNTGKLVDLSFGTISAAGPNAAQPHYHVQKGKARKLKPNEIYLVDSGGQYRDGTTDITRTTIIGNASSAMRKHFTLVLKGMIAVSVARFPLGTTGVQLDALARAALWQHGYDFDHGTGHGVGSFLSVHEGPARISKAGHAPLEAGMIISNEPGYYLNGKYGIRIENLLLVKPAQKPKSGDRPMLSFETLSFAPIDKNLIDESLLTRAEVKWLDHYHATVFKKIGPKIQGSAREWLKSACAPLT